MFLRVLILNFVSLCFFMFVAVPPLAAQDEPGRVALVIGNSAYLHTGELTNPKNDAQVIAKVLRNLDFDVIEVLDLSQNDMKRAIKRFAQKLETGGRGTVGLFYYAGHGVQVAGRNFLIPVNAKISSAVDIEIESVDLETVTNAMNLAGNGFNVVVLDACRDNPFKSSTRALSRGLARISAPKGSLIAYATSPGDVAADGVGENSPYTAALVKTMQVPGLTIERVFKRVRLEVHQTTKETQTPWESSSLTGDFYFLPQDKKPVEEVKVEAKPDLEEPKGIEAEEAEETPPEARRPDAQIAYLRAVEANNLEGYERFLQDYPSHENAARVRQIINSMADDKMWARVKKANRLSSFRQYLAAFPEGTYKGEAQIRIAALQGAIKEKPERKIQTDDLCGHPHGKWSIVDIRRDDVLNVRQGPSIRYPIVGAIPPNGQGISRGECTARNWCLVKYKCVTGWASGKYMTFSGSRPPAVSKSAYYRVIDHSYPDKLNVRKGPSTKFKVVGRIPHNGTNVTVKYCRAVRVHKSRWCLVQWGGVRGWASGRYLANQRTGQRP
ncbi:MAG: hypothetical protein DHS20C08_19790 [Rhodomicrobium sp.]|nr:MAG: hypothetical protein DHS20C08_19790 [Rhodomicrobium sp.]